jgi:crossover junction endodeoxyribonuclease RuvC
MPDAPPRERIILGIDPGLVSTGLGIIAAGETRARLLDTVGVSTRSSEPTALRLGRIHREVRKVLDRWHPETVSIETLFFAKNVRSAVALAHARAAAIVAVSESAAELFEYSPLEIKQAVAGYGRAGKEQVQRMVRVLLGLREQPLDEHIADALACALCHAFRRPRFSDATSPPARADVHSSTTSAKELLARACRGRGRRRRR